MCSFVVERKSKEHSFFLWRDTALFAYIKLQDYPTQPGLLTVVFHYWSIRSNALFFYFCSRLKIYITPIDYYLSTYVNNSTVYLLHTM